MKKNELESMLEKHMAKQFVSKEKLRGNDGVIYTRVSTLEQMMENGSLETQLKIDMEYSVKNNINIVAQFGGKHESAKTDGRKEFQRMLVFVKKNLNVKYIIISNYDRFSRTGASAAKLSEDLRKEYGIIVKSVTQDIDTSTASGRLQENFLHLLNNFDNVIKSERTKMNTKEILLKGYWPYHLPRGYVNIKPKQRACFHQYKITDEGKIIKYAFLLKSEGKFTNREIMQKMKAKGMEMNEKSFRNMFSNSFYAGYVTGNLVDGKLIKGHHLALIDLKTFAKANEILASAPNAKIAKKFHHEELPLKIFARDEVSGDKFSGCKTKGNWYYKTKDAGSPLNVRADIVNRLFVEKLQTFEFKKDKKGDLLKLLANEIRLKLSTQIDDSKQIKKNIAEKKNELDKIEKKYLNDEISKELYEKHSSRIKEEIARSTKLIDTANFDSSNLENAVNNCLGIAQNISSSWVSASFENKQRLQNLIFPEGILYNKKNNEVRTLSTNTLFEAIPIAAKVLEEKRNGNLSQDCQNSLSVPRTGFEPAHPCERCDLNTVRLPISPPGQKT